MLQGSQPSESGDQNATWSELFWRFSMWKTTTIWSANMENHGKPEFLMGQSIFNIHLCLPDGFFRSQQVTYAHSFAKQLKQGDKTKTVCGTSATRLCLKHEIHRGVSILSSKAVWHFFSSNFHDVFFHFLNVNVLFIYFGRQGFQHEPFLASLFNLLIEALFDEEYMAPEIIKKEAYGLSVDWWPCCNWGRTGKKDEGTNLDSICS